VTKGTEVTPAPASAPTPGTPTSGGNVDGGIHDYAVTTVTAIGETTPSPISGGVSVTDHRPPTSAAVLSLVALPSDWAPHAVKVRVTFVYSDGTESSGTADSNTVFVDPSHQLALAIPIGPATVTARRIYPDFGDGYIFYWTVADNVTASVQYASLAGVTSGAIPTTVSANTVPLTGLPAGNWKLYRRSGGAGLKLVTSGSGSTYNDTTANASLGAAAPVTNTAYLQRIPLTWTAPSSSLVTAVNIYGTASGGAQLKFIASVAPATTSYTVTTPDASLGANVPTVNTATANQIALTGLPIGASAVTSRKVYMTASGAAQLKYVHTIADNTTSTDTITTADGSLGANVPTSDGSGLTQPTGQVLAGSTFLIVAGTGAFRTGGGWAVIGNGQQVIRYTGKTGSQLTGIPASGPGSIVASIGYNSTVTAAPVLTGIPASGAGSIRVTILKGDPVNLRVQVDDLPGQAALAARLTTAAVTHDGIKEDAIQDRRLSATEARARGEAYLARKGHESVTVTYTCKDQNQHAGGRASFNLGAPTNLITDLLIKEVTISHFTPALHPDFAATASTD